MVFASTIIFDIPASGTVGNKCLFFYKPPDLWFFAMVAQTTKIVYKYKKNLKKKQAYNKHAILLLLHKIFWTFLSVNKYDSII